MAYTKTNWVAGTTILSEANMDNLETQYDEIQSILTTRGDIFFRNATVLDRLAKGTEGQLLGQGANDPEWLSTVATGTYTGNASDDRQITTGFKCALVLVICSEAGDIIRKTLWVVNNTTGCIRANSTPDVDWTADALLHATDGFVVDEDNANETSTVYYYSAIKAES